jgi:hypothetical protein
VATNGELAYGVDRKKVIGKPFKGEREDKSRNVVNPFLLKPPIILLFVTIMGSIPMQGSLNRAIYDEYMGCGYQR